MARAVIGTLGVMMALGGLAGPAAGAPAPIAPESASVVAVSQAGGAAAQPPAAAPSATPITPAGADFELPEPEEVVMYEINLRAFSREGTLDAVTERVPELAELGINVIWLMPIYPIGQERAKGVLGSPYSIADYTAVSEEYGTLEDLRELVAAAHASGIAILMDWVANHTAWDHPWLAENPGWYTRENGTIVHPPGTDWDDVADLNFANANMRRAMIQAMRFWIEEVGVDGYRCDAADFVPASFWRRANRELRRNAGRPILMLAEGAREDHFQSGFDLGYGWRFFGALKAVFREGRPASATLAGADDTESDIAGARGLWLRFINNHDESISDGSASEIFGGTNGAWGAFVLAATYGGVPLIYNTQEIGYAERIPFFEKSSIDWAAGDQAVRDRYQRLLAFRHESRALQRGRVQAFGNDDVVAFVRRAGSERVTVIVNTRDRQVTLDVPRGVGGRTYLDVPMGAVVELRSGRLTLEPHQSYVLRRE